MLSQANELAAMWCRHCQQETPAVGPAGANGPRCGRCHRTSVSAAEASTESVDADTSRREVYRTLRSAHAMIAAGDAARTLRQDVAHSPLAAAMRSGGESTDAAEKMVGPSAFRPVTPTPRPPRGQVTAWVFATIGATAIGLGIGLTAWSLIGDRPDLWGPGIAAALGGQGLLIVGLVQLVATLWQAGRQATAKLHAMHDELRMLRRSTDELAGRHHASPVTFYADLTRGASDETLMGNLRGQLDRLAARVRQQD